MPQSNASACRALTRLHPTPVRVLLALLCVTVVPEVSRADDLAKLLKRPLSPGVLALLLDHNTDPRVLVRLREALTDESPRVRATAARLLHVASDSKSGPALRAALLVETDQEAALEEARALLSLRDPADDALVLEAGRRLSSKTLMTVVERQALSVEEPGVSTGNGSNTSVTENGRLRQPSEFAVVRTVEPLPSGYIEDVLRITGCKPRKDLQVGGAVVRYDQHQRLSLYRPVTMTASKGCVAAARYLTVASLQPVPTSVVADRDELVVLPMHDAFFKCLARHAAPVGEPPVEPKRIGAFSEITPPKKVRDLRPIYPPAFIKERKQGLVVVEATISPSGCITRAEVLRGVEMGFDISALWAVTGWEFTPTLLAGQPVPVIMTVTVQFTLTPAP